MHREHRRLLEQIRQEARARTDGAEPTLDAYGGSGHPLYGLPVPVRRRLAKNWVAAQHALAPEAYLEVVESLFGGASHEEKTLAALLLTAHRGVRAMVRPAWLERWLEQLNGWSEVDSLCQSTFGADQLLASWPSWRALLRRLARHPNINHRRAALVLLTGPVRYSSDTRLQQLAFENIARLQHERDILITKAISWLLRALVTQHAQAVRSYLAQNAATLPKIALRETRTKLETGRKNARRL